jgi:hypothetical protein
VFRRCGDRPGRIARAGGARDAGAVQDVEALLAEGAAGEVDGVSERNAARRVPGGLRLRETGDVDEVLAAAPSAVAASGLRRLRPGVEMRLGVAVRGESA